MSPSSPSASLVLSLAAALWAEGAAPPARPGPAGTARTAIASQSGDVSPGAPGVSSVGGGVPEHPRLHPPAHTPAFVASATPGPRRPTAGEDERSGRVEGTRGSSTGTPAPPGRIVGVVRLTAATRREPRADAYAPRVVRPAPRSAAPEVRHVVVFLTGVPPQADLAPMHATVRQRDESFEPRVVAVTRGSTVDFPNDDPFFHNVFSLSRAASFDLGRYAKGDSRSRVFPKAGLVKLYCDLHAYMSGVIFVFDHPWFAIPDEAGRFVLDGVPAGRHTVMAWHERIGEAEVTVVVEPGLTSDVAFVLPVLES